MANASFWSRWSSSSPHSYCRRNKRRSTTVSKESSWRSTGNRLASAAYLLSTLASLIRVHAMDDNTPRRFVFQGSQAEPSGANQEHRQPAAASCLTCRRRKVKCDHLQPVCSACRKGKHACSYAKPNPPTLRSPKIQTGRTSRPKPRAEGSEIRNRLEKLEKLLEIAITKSTAIPKKSDEGNGTTENRNGRGPKTDSAVPVARTAKDETHSIDGYDGTLFLEAKNGQSIWVSSLHYSLLADEIRDVKLLLGDQARNDTPENPFFEHASIFSTVSVKSLMPWSPSSADDCFALLEAFISNVDPMIRLVHKPSLKRRFTHYVHEMYGTTDPNESDESETSFSDAPIHSFEPLALAIFHSAVNSLSPENVTERFGIDQKSLLAKFQQGAELSLAREGFLTTSNMEVLQAFVLLLTCQSREEELSKTWSLLGIALRLALAQGLHREPSLFASDNMDVIQIELRRRLWHQICLLDYRAAEGKGQEPTISDDDFTTLLPRNVNDEDLVEGRMLADEVYSYPSFTDMTRYLVRLNGVHCFRRIVKSTYQLKCRIKSTTLSGNDHRNPIMALQKLFDQVCKIVTELVSYLQTQYLQYCDPSEPSQRLTLGLAAIIEWRCWSIFWIRIPKQYREAIVSRKIRIAIFTNSVSLMETMNQMPNDRDLGRFQCHAGGHACYQAIMHVISELKTPEFQKTDHFLLRTRALNALEWTEKTRQHESSGVWQVINRTILKFLATESSNSIHPTLGPSIPLPQETMAVVGTTTTEAFQPPQVISGNIHMQDIFEDFNTSLPPELEDLGNLDMHDQNSRMSFDWGFWGVDTSI